MNRRKFFSGIICGIAAVPAALVSLYSATGNKPVSTGYPKYSSKIKGLFERDNSHLKIGHTLTLKRPARFRG